MHTLKGLTDEQVVKAVVKGMQASPIEGGVIVCALRNLGPEHSLKMARLAASSGAVGFDVAGYETGFPLTLHKQAIKYAVACENLGVTVHAGEWVNEGNESELVSWQVPSEHSGQGCKLMKNYHVHGDRQS